MQKVLPGGANRKALCGGSARCTSTTFAEVLQAVDVVLQVSKDSKISWISESLCIGWNLRTAVHFCNKLFACRSFRILVSSQVAVYV